MKLGSEVDYKCTLLASHYLAFLSDWAYFNFFT